jgi:myosin heavy subunit
MTKLKITLIIATVAISLTVTFILHRNAQAKLLKNDEALNQQSEQLAKLVAEQGLLSNQVAEARSSTKDRLSELARLQNQAQALQNQTNEFGSQLKSNRQARLSQSTPKSEPPPPEYFVQLHRAAGAKARDAVNLSQALAQYAWDHQGRFPSNLEQVTTYLQKKEMSLSGTNQFDIVYWGSLDDLKGIPGGAVALIRDRQIWIAPSGKLARVYGLANGSSRIVESDDDFTAWEAEHIVSAAPDGK